MKYRFATLALVALPMVGQATVEPPEEGSSISPEPEITIIDGDKKRMEVMSINGQVYSIKVIPKNGKPYYLVDKMGDGEFIRDSAADRMQVPEWVIISW